MQRTRILSNSQVFWAALTTLFGFFASGVLGFVRTGVLSAIFGTSAAHGAFLAAQRIPELIFVLVAGGALGSSFIPIYAQQRELDEARAWQLASTVMTFAAFAAALLGLLVMLFAEPLVARILLPNSPSDVQAMTVAMTRLMMVTPMIFAVSGLIMGILQSHGLFFLPSVAISMNSIGIIIGAVVLAPMLASQPYTAVDALAATPAAFAGSAHLPVDQVGNASVYGLAYGAILSALLHLLVQLPGLWRVGAHLRPMFNYRLDGVWDVLRLMGPRVLGLGVVQLNFLVNVNLSDGMVDGSYVALTTAFTLMFFALGIVGQSVGSAVFPTLSALYAAGNLEEFKSRLAGAMRSVLFLALPATVAFIVMGEPLVSIFERGAWTHESTQATAWALAFYATGITGFVLLEVLSRAFYAIADTWTPVLVGIGAMVSNIALSLVLIQVIGDPNSLARGAFAGLAFANALTTLVEALILWGLISRRLGGIHDQAIIRLVTQAMVAAGLMGAILWGLYWLPIRGFVLAIIGAAIGGSSYFAITYLMGLEEARTILAPLLRRLRLT